MIYLVKTDYSVTRKILINIPDRFIVPKKYAGMKIYPAPKTQRVTNDFCNFFGCGTIFEYTNCGYIVNYDNIKNLDRDFLLYIIDENIKYTLGIEHSLRIIDDLGIEHSLRIIDDGVDFLYSDALQKLKEEILAHDDNWIKDIAIIKDIIE